MSHLKLPITKVPQFFPSFPGFMYATVYPCRPQTFCPSFLNWKIPMADQHETLFLVKTPPQVISNRTFASPVAECREDLVFSNKTNCHLPWGKEWIFYSKWQNHLSAIHGCMLSPFNHLHLFMTPWTVAHQAPLSMRILQARILEWAAMPSIRGAFQSKDRTQVSCIAGMFSTVRATREYINQFI